MIWLCTLLISWWRWLISSLRTTLSWSGLCCGLGGYGVALAEAPDVDGVGLDFLGMVPVKPVPCRMMGLLCWAVAVAAAAAATTAAFSSLSFLIIRVLRW